MRQDTNKTRQAQGKTSIPTSFTCRQFSQHQSHQSITSSFDRHSPWSIGISSYSVEPPSNPPERRLLPLLLLSDNPPLFPLSDSPSPSPRLAPGLPPPPQEAAEPDIERSMLLSLLPCRPRLCRPFAPPTALPPPPLPARSEKLQLRRGRLRTRMLTLLRSRLRMRMSSRAIFCTSLGVRRDGEMSSTT